MANLKTGLDQFLLSAQVMINNALTDEVIKQSLAAYGYTDETLLAGKKLYERVTALQNLRYSEYGEQIAATSELKKSKDKAKQQYMKTLKIARVALKESAKAGEAIMLCGVRKRNLSGWLEQAQIFYANLLRDVEFITRLSAYGYTREKLEREFALIDQVIAKSLAQKKETGEAQEATIIRDKALDDLAAWISDFKAVVRVALADNPQQLEKLGIIVKS